MADEYDASFVEHLLDEALKSMRVKKKGFSKDITNLIMELADLAQVRELVLPNITSPTVPTGGGVFQPPIGEVVSPCDSDDGERSGIEDKQGTPKSVAGGAATAIRLLREEADSLKVGSTTEDGRTVISARTCVVCGMDNNPGESRKSGFKCHTCVGLPSRRKFAVKVEESDHLDKNYADDGLKVINNYIFLNKLGNGAYGKVKLAQHVVSGQQYAVKIVRKSAMRKVSRGNQSGMDMMHQEIEIMKALKHPCISSITSVVDDPQEEKLYIFMELLSGGQVYEIGPDGTSPRPPIEIERLKKYIVGMASGLQYLHSKGIVHRDIKPENILLDGHDNIKLADFGVSSQCDEDQCVMSESAGSPAYWCPEEYSQVPVQGRAQDIWALGVTVFAMATGHLPFFSPDRAKMEELIRFGELKFPSDIDPLLADLISKMLAKDQEQRIKISGIFEHAVLFDVRTVKGFPVETIKANVEVLDSLDDVVAATKDDTATLRPDGYFTKNDKVSSPGKGFDALMEFIGEKGPHFQVVRSAAYSLTLYSLKADPRRKSVLERSKSIEMRSESIAGVREEVEVERSDDGSTGTPGPERITVVPTTLGGAESPMFIVDPDFQCDSPRSGQSPTMPESPGSETPLSARSDRGSKSPLNGAPPSVVSLDNSLSGGVTAGSLQTGPSVPECPSTEQDAEGVLVEREAMPPPAVESHCKQ